MLVEHMPVTFSVDDLVEQVLLLQKLEQAQKEFKTGKEWIGMISKDGAVVKIVLLKTARLNFKEIVDYIKRQIATITTPTVPHPPSAGTSFRCRVT